MKTTMDQPDDDLLRELLDVLDCEQIRMEHTLRDLDRLRAAMIKRDEGTLDELFRDAQRRQVASIQLDQRREDVRCRLAEQIGVETDRMNLTRLVRGLSKEWKESVKSRQDKLRGLARLLKMEHRLTALLLADCSRLNRALLGAMLGCGGEAVVYNSQGRSNWELKDQLVSIQM